MKCKRHVWSRSVKLNRKRTAYVYNGKETTCLACGKTRAEVAKERRELTRLIVSGPDERWTIDEVRTAVRTRAQWHRSEGREHAALALERVAEALNVQLWRRGARRVREAQRVLS